MKIRLAVEVLSRETQVDGRSAERLRLGVPEGFAFPAPDDLLGVVGGQAVGHQVVGVQVGDGLEAGVIVNLRDRHPTFQPQVVPDEVTLLGGLGGKTGKTGSESNFSIFFR